MWRRRYEGGCSDSKSFLIFSLVALEFNMPKDGFSFFIPVFPACPSDLCLFFFTFQNPNTKGLAITCYMYDRHLLRLLWTSPEIRIF